VKRTTIFIEEQVERDLQAVARKQGRPVASVVREAIATYVVNQRETSHRLPSFAGVGASGRRDVAERYEELLWEDLEPHVNAPAEPSAVGPGTRRAHRGSSAGPREPAAGRTRQRRAR
jgi:hypothetical protein